MKLKKIPSLIAIFILTISVFVGVFAVENSKIRKSSAYSDISPQNVAVTNLNYNTFTITWTTKNSSTGFIKWGENILLGINNQTNPDNQAYVHSITLENLKPTTNYFFKINSNGIDFLDNSKYWKIETPKKFTAPDRSIVVNGQILSPDKQPLNDVLVLVKVGGGLEMSAKTKEGGIYTIPISNSIKSDLSGYAEIGVPGSVIELTAISGQHANASAQLYSAIANQVPPIILGNSYDFKKLVPKSVDEIPIANIKTSEEATTTEAVNSESVSLENPQSGEVTDESLQFEGKGPAGELINITVQSDPQEGEVIVNQDGKWSWKPPQKLEPGEHNVIIEWKNAAGKNNKYISSFVVKAQNEDLNSIANTITPTLIPTLIPQASNSKTAPIQYIFNLYNDRKTLFLAISGVAIVAFIVLVLLIYSISKRKSKKANSANTFPPTQSTETPVNNQIHTKSKNPVITILVSLASLILLGVTAFTAYKFYQSRNLRREVPNEEIAQIFPTQTPTSAPTLIPTLQIIPTPLPTSKTTPTATPTPPLPTIKPSPTQKPLPSPTVTSTNAISPTLSPTRIPSPTLSEEKLPVAGVSLPTIITFSFAIILIIFSFSLLSI